MNMFCEFIFAIHIIGTVIEAKASPVKTKVCRLELFIQTRATELNSNTSHWKTKMNNEYVLLVYNHNPHHWSDIESKASPVKT